MRRSLPIAGPALAGWCRTCVFKDPCGGLDGDPAMFGCFTDCGRSCDRDAGGKCDYTCPRHEDRWMRRWAEVGGWPPKPAAELRSPSGKLPRYVPIVWHSSSREAPLDVKHVAVPTFAIVGGSVARYGPRVRSASELREKMRFRSDADVLFISVAADPELEKYWQLARERGVAERLASLGLWGMTAPNFSFFDLVPRTHILHNRTRIVRAAEVLSRAGVPAILHVNAAASADWRYWAALLRAQPAIKYVVKEFQTGSRMDWPSARRAIAGLRQLQDHVEQDLHPIIVGGTQYAPEISAAFENVTFVDSRPFMNAVHRQRFVLDVLGARWETSPTEAGAPIDELIDHNIRIYRRHVELLCQRVGGDTAYEAASVESPDELLTTDDLEHD